MTAGQDGMPQNHMRVIGKISVAFTVRMLLRLWRPQNLLLVWVRSTARTAPGWCFGILSLPSNFFLNAIHKAAEAAAMDSTTMVRSMSTGGSAHPQPSKFH